jgi:hypothetical protein
MVLTNSREIAVKAGNTPTLCASEKSLKFEMFEHERQIKVKTINALETVQRAIPFKAFK